MNNNNNQKGKESDIITKKGFLISLPGKKKQDGAAESSIHLANADLGRKNEKNRDASQDKGAIQDKSKQGGHDGRNENKNRFNKHRVKDKNGDKTVENTDRSADGNRLPGKHDKDNRRKNEHCEDSALKPAEKSRDNSANSENSQLSVKNDRNDRKSRHGKNHNRDRKKADSVRDVNAFNEKIDVEKNVKDNKDNRDNRERNHGKDRHGDKNRRNDDRKSKFQPLSALSADISEYSVKQEAVLQNETVKELSLEEKYKNAKPLAEQIAEQEMRAKGIKMPSDSEKEPESVEIVGVRFREAGKIYYFDPDGRVIPFGTPVIVETARGSEYGYTAISNRFVPCNSLSSSLKKIERIATEIDTQKHVANRELEASAEGVFKEKVAKLGLEMNLIYVEYTFDNSRLLFYFTAETRIDFRELVKELASVFRTRIELRQIGVRDEAKAIGGIGVCGRANCCNTFLGDFAQVSIKMAKDQSLSLNAAKISGACGKLMCCLRYEDKVYEEENARTPKVGSVVETPEGKGHVVERNVLKGTVKVALDLSPDAAAQPFSRDDVKVVGFNKSKSDEDDSDDNLDELKDVEG